MLRDNISYPCFSSTLREKKLSYPEIDGFATYLTQHRGVRAPDYQLYVATCFLDFLADSGKQIVSVHQKNIDDFITEQGAHYQRKTVASIASFLRAFFRYLFFMGTLEKDFSESVHRPYIFYGERDPRYLRPWQIKQILFATKKDKTFVGKRDHAIVVLLAIYGLRGHEVSRIQLDDLCWRTKKLTISSRKCGDILVLPMIAPAGQALADYLYTRPPVEHREIFLSSVKPFNPLGKGAISAIICRVIKRCGVDVAHPGTHTFRFSNAQVLFQAQRPLSEIAGILGHSDFRTTLGYLSFVVHPLREVAINDGEAMA